MPNYKESTITGTSYTRANTVTIHNPLNAIPSIHITEESVVQVGDKSILLPVASGHLYGPFNPSNQIALLNPNTLEPTGQTMTEQEVYIALFSKYIAMAQARDAAQAAPPVPPQPPVPP